MAITNVEVASGTGVKVAVDQIATVNYQLVKLAVGAAGTANVVSNSDPIPISDANGSLTVDNSGTFAVQATQAGTWNVNAITTLPALAAGTNAIGKLAANSGVDIGDVDITSVIPGTGNTNLGKAVDSVAGSTDTGVAALFKRVDTLASITPAVGDYAPGLVNVNGALWVQVANGVAGLVDDAAFTPATDTVLAAGYTLDDTATDTVNEGDIGAARMTPNRKIITQPYESEANRWSYAAPSAGLVSTTEVTAKAAAGSGLRNYITSLQVMNSNGSTGTDVQILDGTGGTVLHRGYVAANGSYSAQFPVPLMGTANTLVSIKEGSATTTNGVFVNLQGYIGN